MTKIIWDRNVSFAGTSYQGELKAGTFSSAQTTLLDLASGQSGRGQSSDKTTAQWLGTFEGETFTLYDYRGSHELHIGGRKSLNVAALLLELRTILGDV